MHTVQSIDALIQSCPHGMPLAAWLAKEFNPPECFVIIQRGIYRHAIVGVFGTLDEAKASARRQIEKEHDDWHHMEVSKAAFGSDAPFEPLRGWPYSKLEDSEVVWSLYRQADGPGEYAYRERVVI